MVDDFGTTALRWWASRVQARSTGTRARGRPDPEHLELPHDPAAGVAAHPLGTRLAGAPEVLTRLATVQPGTVAVVLSAGQPGVVRHPGELLVPPLLTRSPGRVRALAVSTAPVHVDVTVPDLVTLDRFTVESFRLRLELQLDGSDGYAAVAALAARHGAQLDRVLLAEVERESLAAVRAAVSMNRQADLERLTLLRVLADRWLPAVLAAGTLIRRDLRLIEHGRGLAEEEPTVVLPSAGGPGVPDPGTDEAAPLARVM